MKLRYLTFCEQCNVTEEGHICNRNKDGLLFNGYDYEHQAWVAEGKYARCNHPEDMDCQCFGKENEGISVLEIRFRERMEDDSILFREVDSTGQPFIELAM